MSIPEGAATVTAEAGDLRKAIAAAAEELGLVPSQVDYKLDLSHFRSTTGVSVSRSTVKIVAWSSGRDPEAEPEKPARKSESSDAGDDGDAKPRRERKPRKPRRGSDEDDAPMKGAAGGTTEASEWAQGWFTKVLEFMSLEGEVVATGDEERVHLRVKVDKAGRLIGRRGATLGAIRHLLGQGLANKFGEFTVDVDVADDRDDREPRGRDRDRDRDRGGRSRDRKRGGRRERDDRRRGGRRRSSEKGKYPEEKLQQLARRAASKAKESGQTITIKLGLNSYDRRVVHVEISEIDGVDSQSEERTITDDDGLESTVKYIQVFATDD